jgi:hypothetical protein
VNYLIMAGDRLEPAITIATTHPGAFPFGKPQKRGDHASSLTRPKTARFGLKVIRPARYCAIRTPEDEILENDSLSMAPRSPSSPKPHGALPFSASPLESKVRYLADPACTRSRNVALLLIVKS